MSMAISGYVYAGFQVSESDFWVTDPAPVATCSHGHEQTGTGPFCSEDGTKFIIRQVRTPTDKLAVLALNYDLALRPGDYEQFWEKLLDDPFEETDQIRLRQINKVVPSRSAQWAIAKQLGCIHAWEESSRSGYAFGVDRDVLDRAIDLLERWRYNIGVKSPVRLFFSLYVSA